MLFKLSFDIPWLINVISTELQEDGVMARASLLLPTGTTVEIEGTAEEVAELLSLYARLSVPVESRKDKRGLGLTALANTSGKPKAPRKGPKAYVLQLHQSGFFDEKRSLPQVQEKLEAEGHIYPQSSLSTPLIRLVRSRVLRRLKEDGAWVYVNA
jgi:hypothetical protein